MSARVAVMFCKHVMIGSDHQCIQFTRVSLVAIKHEISPTYLAQAPLCFIGPPLFAVMMLESF